MSETVSEREAAPRGKRLRWQTIAEYVIVVAIILESIFFAAYAPQFLSVPNLVNIALSIAITGILAVGMTAVILTGGIDLSVGSVAALAGVVAAMIAASDFAGSVALASLAALGVGLAVGIFNGVMVAWFRVPPFVTTLAMLTICRGLAFVLTGGRAVGNLPAGFGLFGREHLLGVPVPVILMLLVFAAGWFVLRRMTFGRYVYAVGGTSLNGGRGSVIATLWGAVFIGVLNNGLNLAGIDPYMQRIALGAVILLAVLADQINKSRGQLSA